MYADFQEPWKIHFGLGISSLDHNPCARGRGRHSRAMRGGSMSPPTVFLPHALTSRRSNSRGMCSAYEGAYLQKIRCRNSCIHVANQYSIRGLQRSGPQIERKQSFARCRILSTSSSACARTPVGSGRRGHPRLAILVDLRSGHVCGGPRLIQP